LSVLIFPVVSVNLFLSLFSAQEKPEIFAKLILITSVLNVILNLVLINALISVSQEWATAGVAIATTFSWVFYLFSFKFFSKRKLKLKISFKSVVKPFFSSMIMSLFLLLFIREVGDMNFTLGILSVLVGAVIYFISMALLKGITIKDLNLVKIILKHGKKD
jgi:Na+-driven multidrug efflux pump